MYDRRITIRPRRAQREQVAADALAALGNRTRLRVFKLLVRAGSRGANIGTIQRLLDIPATTLGHHLGTLTTAGLVDQDRLAAIAVGLLGGFGVLVMQRFGLLVGPPLQDGVGNGGCSGSKIRDPKAVVWRFWRETGRRETFRAGARQNALFLGKWLVLAFVLESLMVAYVPGDLIAGIAGDGSFLSILAATLVGIPSYLNGSAALPLVAGLMDKGMAPGAAMAFLVGGGVTSIPAALAVWAVTRLPVFAAYLAFATLGAVLSGVAYQVVAG